MTTKSITEFTDQELTLELKKRKQLQIFFGILIGIALGVAVWSATHKGGFPTFFSLFLCLFLFQKSRNSIKEVTDEIDARK
jgi:uncharacterized membrane protein